MVICASSGLGLAQTYNLSGTFNDGGTLSGTFTFASGTFSSVNIVTTAGSVRTSGAVYSFVCGQASNPSCSGLPPGAGDALYLTTSAGNQTGLPAIALFFSPGLGASTVTLSGLEANCVDAACSAPVAPTRFLAAGSHANLVTSVPTLSEMGLVLLAMALAGTALLRLRQQGNPARNQ
jgi:hypothetical protein